VRVVAYTRTNYTIFAGYGDYIATSTVVGTQTVLEPVPATPALTATLGVPYRFVAYSLNNTSPMMPFSNTHDIPDGVDLLWGFQDETTPYTGIAHNVHINMKHQFSKIELKVDATGVDGTVFNFENISFTSASIQGYRANMEVQTGKLTASEPNPRQFQTQFPPSPSPIPDLTSDPVLVYTNGTTPTRVRIGSISLVGHPTYAGPYTAAYNTALLPGRSYIIEIHIRWDNAPPGSLAGSNIYWDGTKLTFDPAGVYTRSRYQGVYFKWGSLVGLGIPAGAGTFTSIRSTTPFYIPSYDTWSPPVSSWTRQVGYYNSWDEIPSYYGAGYGVPSSQRGPAIQFLKTIPSSYYEIHRGDICKYLGETGAGPKGYVMPASQEFYPVMSSAWTRNQTSQSYPGNLTNDGTGIIERGWSELATGNHLPSSRSRIAASGNNSNYTRYATGSASNNQSSSYHFRIYNANSGTRAMNRASGRRRGYVVRCIKEGGEIPGIELYPIIVDHNDWIDDGFMSDELELEDDD
jgi:uncharacterized protein (TIGR02145 family)